MRPRYVAWRVARRGAARVAGAALVGAGIAGCSVVDALNEEFADPEASPIAPADYVEYQDGMELVPGVKVDDPDGHMGAKPTLLQEVSAYYSDGAWYVVDPLALGQEARDLYLDRDPAWTDEDAYARALVVVEDLQLCIVYIEQNDDADSAGYRADMLWYAKGAGDASPDGVGADVDGLRRHGWISASAWEDSVEDAFVAAVDASEARDDDEVDCGNVAAVLGSGEVFPTYE